MYGKMFRGTLVLSAAWLLFSLSTVAQAPPGPLQGQPPQPASPSAKPPQPAPEIKPRTTIFGNWKLNRDESDDARKKMEDSRRSNTSYGGPRMGGPFPGNGPYGGRRRTGGEGEEGQNIQGMIEASRSLNIAQAKKDVEVDIFDDGQRKSAFYTDGRKVQKSKDPNNQEIAAHWDGNRLVTDEKTPRGGKMSRTYELSEDGLQLWETVRLQVGRSNAPVNIRYVYDQVNLAQTSR